jgi:hypothetical protein
VDLLLIQRDAWASSLLTNLTLALEARRAGREAALLVTEEALAALAAGSFAWPRELSGPRLRLALADRAKAAGLPVAGRGEGRRIDAPALVASAREAGVRLYACPIWTRLLALEADLPDGLEPIEAGALLELIGKSGRVVGTL